MVKIFYEVVPKKKNEKVSTTTNFNEECFERFANLRFRLDIFVLLVSGQLNSEGGEGKREREKKKFGNEPTTE